MHLIWVNFASSIKSRSLIPVKIRIYGSTLWLLSL